MKTKKTMHPVLISVIMPIYNAEVFLNDAINSILSQTFVDFEILALDDGSTDASKDIVQSYDDKRVRYISCKHNFVNTLNKGIMLSKGKYIALLDHDDIMMPYRLSLQYDFMEAHPEIIACGGYMHSFGQNSDLMQVPIKHYEIIEDMIIGSVMLNPTGFIRKSALLENKIKYSKGYFFSADYKMWLDLAKAGTIENIPKVLTLYRTSDKQAHLVYRKECILIERKIKMELLNYFFSNLKKNNKYSKMIDEELIPVINKLEELNCYSPFAFYLFIYQLVKFFRMKGVIIV